MFETSLGDGGVLNTVSVVIPTWNRADLLRSILLNLREQTVLPKEILVIDNGSRDESAAVAKEFAVRLVTFQDNRGFAVAVNEGIRQATGDRCERGGVRGWKTSPAGRERPDRWQL